MSFIKFFIPTEKFILVKIALIPLITLGSADDNLIAKDFSLEQRQSFTITREILWESEIASRSEVCQKEVEFIKLYRSNDPSIGYNQWPKFEAPYDPA